MAVLIDIIGSAVIAGILLVTIFGLNSNLNQSTYNKTFSLITQTNAVTLARMLESDLVKIGYRAPKPAVLAAKSDSLVFQADLRDAGTLNTVCYFIGPASALGLTKNPRDRMIYRVEDGNVTAANLGVTSLSFTYYSGDGTLTASPTWDPNSSIDVQFRVESTEPVDTSYAVVFWEKRIYPRNL